MEQVKSKDIDRELEDVFLTYVSNRNDQDTALCYLDLDKQRLNLPSNVFYGKLGLIAQRWLSRLQDITSLNQSQWLINSYGQTMFDDSYEFPEERDKVITTTFKDWDEQLKINDSITYSYKQAKSDVALFEVLKEQEIIYNDRMDYSFDQLVGIITKEVDAIQSYNGLLNNICLYNCGGRISAEQINNSIQSIVKRNFGTHCDKIHGINILEILSLKIQLLTNEDKARLRTCFVNLWDYKHINNYTYDSRCGNKTIKKDGKVEFVEAQAGIECEFDPELSKIVKEAVLKSRLLYDFNDIGNVPDNEFIGALFKSITQMKEAFYRELLNICVEHEINSTNLPEPELRHFLSCNDDLKSELVEQMRLEDMSNKNLVFLVEALEQLKILLFIEGQGKKFHLSLKKEFDNVLAYQNFIKRYKDKGYADKEKEQIAQFKEKYSRFVRK